MTQLWFRAALLPEGWSSDVRLVLKDGGIVSVSTGVAPTGDDETHGLALPGLHNLHSHAFQRAMAGRAERRGREADNFWSWRTHMYRLAQSVGPDDLEAIAALAYAEMLESGFVRVGEFHYVHHDLDGAPYANPGEMAERLAAAASAVGIDLTLLPVFYAQSGFGGLPPGEGQRRFICDVEGYGRLLEASGRAISSLPGARLGVAPHSLRAVTPDSLAAVTQILRDGPIHIHIAEQQKEVDDCLAWSGRRPVDWLMNAQAVDGRWCLVHATHVDAGEVAAMTASGAVVGLCPITEANLGDGIFPAHAFQAEGGRYGVGSDSNVAIDAAGELRLLEYGQRLIRRERNVLGTPEAGTADELYARARDGGAQALGGDAETLAPGQPATFIALDDRDPAMLGFTPDEILARWVFAARRPIVDGVWMRGRQVVRNGLHRDRAAIVARYGRSVARLNSLPGA